MTDHPDSADRQTVKPLGIAYLIGRADHALTRRMRDCLAPIGLTVNQYTALSVLNARSELSNAQLAERSLVSPQAANEMVKTMENKGWIERTPDPSHGRIILIRVTDLGRDLLRQCDAAVARLETAMLTGLSERDRTVLREQLHTLVRTLGAMVVDPREY